jgi:O-antigen ligase
VLALSIMFHTWRKRWNMGATVLLVSLVWFLVCALLAEYRDLAIEKTVTTFKYFIPLAFISATLCTRKAQKTFLYALAASVGVWLAHHGIVALTTGMPVEMMAIRGGQMSDRNDFLVAGTACIPMLIYAAFHYDWRWKKWVRLGIHAAVVLSIVAVIYGNSRGAYVGFTGLLVWWAFLTGRLFKRVALAAVIAGVIIVALPGFVWNRMSTIEVSGQQTEGSARNRMDHMETAVRITLDYPLTGIGADNFVYVAPRYSPLVAEPHSLWLKCSAEYGIPMLVFFVLVVALFLIRLRRRALLARSLGDKEGEALATALNCALFGFLATGSFTSQFLSEYLWAIIGLVGAFLVTPLEPAPGRGPELDREIEAAAAAPRAV